MVFWIGPEHLIPDENHNSQNYDYQKRMAQPETMEKLKTPMTEHIN